MWLMFLAVDDDDSNAALAMVVAGVGEGIRQDYPHVATNWVERKKYTISG